MARGKGARNLLTFMQYDKLLDDDFNEGKKAAPVMLKYGNTRRDLKAMAKRNIKKNNYPQYWKGVLSFLGR